MKENTLLEMKNKIEALGRVTQHVLNELSHLKELSIGTLETLKLMPGYDEALEQLKESITKKQTEDNGVIEQDSK